VFKISTFGFASLLRFASGMCHLSINTALDDRLFAMYIGTVFHFVACIHPLPKKKKNTQRNTRLTWALWSGFGWAA
jgi:hypothetical protein